VIDFLSPGCTSSGTYDSVLVDTRLAAEGFAIAALCGRTIPSGSSFLIAHAAGSVVTGTGGGGSSQPSTI